MKHNSTWLLSIAFWCNTFSPLYASETEEHSLRCKEGSMHSCKIVGQMFEWGTGGLKKNRQMAEQLYRKACEGGLSSACHHLDSLQRLSR